MLEKIESLPAGIDGLRAVGKLSREDYERVFQPLVDDARREGRRVRLLYQFGPEFEGFTPAGAWQDAKLGLRAMRLFEACAIVSDVGWIRETAGLIGFLMPCPVRVFGNEERSEAAEWLDSLPEAAGVSHRLLPESGVIVVEVTGPLHAQDFDSVAMTADAWLEANQDLSGLVVHARTFPGWENIGSFLRHVRFVRDHHRRIRRIALAADSKLADVAPRLAEHFVQAEIQGFGFDELDRAIAWAAGRGEDARAPTPNTDAPSPSM